MLSISMHCRHPPPPPYIEQNMSPLLNRRMVASSSVESDGFAKNHWHISTHFAQQYLCKTYDNQLNIAPASMTLCDTGNNCNNSQCDSRDLIG